MIKRTYFCSAEVYADNVNTVTSRAWRSATFKSLFPLDATDICREFSEEIAKGGNTKVDRVLIVQFNRVQ